MITERTTEKGLTFLDIATPLCEASLCLQGAHLVKWIPKGHQDALFLSADSLLEPGAAIRGGIPVCWPWFGKKEGCASHGVARVSAWTLDHYDVNSSNVASIHLRLYPEDESQPIALLRITLGNELRMCLQTTARKSDCLLTTAFHNYLNVGHLSNCRITGLNGLNYEDFGVVSPAPDRPNAALMPYGGIDRIYSSPTPLAALSIEDGKLKRKIVIESENAYSAIVWNPGEKGAKAMKDLANGEWKQFICLEPAVTQPAPIKLSPGHTHIMRQTIKIKPLA